MDIFSPPCCEVSAYCGTLVISIWVNYRLLGNFTATTSVCTHACVSVCVGGGRAENTYVCEATEKDLERITLSEKAFNSKRIEYRN